MLTSLFCRVAGVSQAGAWTSLQFMGPGDRWEFDSPSPAFCFSFDCLIVAFVPFICSSSASPSSLCFFVAFSILLLAIFLRACISFVVDEVDWYTVYDFLAWQLRRFLSFACSSLPLLLFSPLLRQVRCGTSTKLESARGSSRREGRKTYNR